jgi:hypothetical protein
MPVASMKKTKAKWMRFWHCIGGGLVGHRLVTGYDVSKFYGVTVKKKTIYIGCECGKTFYGKL